MLLEERGHKEIGHSDSSIQDPLIGMGRHSEDKDEKKRHSKEIFNNFILKEQLVSGERKKVKRKRIKSVIIRDVLCE